MKNKNRLEAERRHKLLQAAILNSSAKKGQEEIKTVSEREAPGIKFQLRTLQMEFYSPQGVPK